LLERTARKLVARNAAGEAEIVFDARGCLGLAPRRFTLDAQCAQPLGCAVHRGGEAGWSAAHDYIVVFGKACACLQTEELRNIASLWFAQHLAVCQSQHRAITLLWEWLLPECGQRG